MAAHMDSWRTGISDIVADPGAEDSIVRSVPLSELIGTLSFAEMMFLLLQGRRATPAQARVLDALLVAGMEHGIGPPAMVARCMASYGCDLQTALAAGVATFGATMGGAGEAFARALVRQLDPHERGAPARDDDAIAKAATAIVAEARAEGRRVPGYGIPLHGADPRAPQLLGIAREAGLFGPYCRLGEAIEDAIAAAGGRRIAMNLDGAGAVLALDLGFSWRLAKLFIIAPRTVSMAAHYIEEQGQGTRWRHVPASQVTYETD